MAYSNVRESTKKRHQFITKMFNKLMAPNVHGLYPDMDNVIQHIEGEIGYSAGYIREILKKA